MKLHDLTHIMRITAYHDNYAVYMQQFDDHFLSGVIDRSETVLLADQPGLIFILKDDLVELCPYDGTANRYYNLKTGEWCSRPSYPESNEFKDDAETPEGMIPVGPHTYAYEAANGCYGFIDKSGKEIYPPVSSVFSRSRHADRFVVTDEQNHRGVIDAEGNILLPFLYDGIFYYRNLSCYSARKDGRVGLLNEQGNQLLPFEYDCVCVGADDGLSCVGVCKDGHGYFINI